MFSMPRIPDGDRYYARTPIPHESFGTSVEYWFAAHDLCTGAVDLDVVSI